MGIKANYQDFSDAQLVDILRIGDASGAFSEILKRYSGILINFTYRRVGDLPLAEDLLHDSFVYLWEKRLSLQLKNGLESFIFTVVRNRILDYFKHQKVSQKYINDFHKFLSGNESNTDHLIRYNDLSALIDREINALPEKMRVVFELVRKQNMSRKEIAEFLDIPENTVKTNMQRALKILRGRLGEVVVVFLFVHY
jgi:RNA polymerase sigma-70 factor (family 1)